MSYTSVTNDLLLEDSVNWPLVAAAPGYFTVDEQWPYSEPEAVLAWRVNQELVLPVTRRGFEPRESWIVYPDGKVRHHGVGGPSAVPYYVSVEDWQNAVRKGEVGDRIIGSPSGEPFPDVSEADIDTFGRFGDMMSPEDIMKMLDGICVPEQLVTVGQILRKRSEKAAAVESALAF
jgi:hypothetical protein